MGWSKGSQVFQSVARAAKRYIADHERADFYRAVLPAFNACDWDTQAEVLGEDPVLDAVLHEDGLIEEDR